MTLPESAMNASQGGLHPVLFGLLADGSGEARFAGCPAVHASSPVDPGWSHFSPSGDWYGRWAVRPLRGVLAEPPNAGAGSVSPEDIVILAPRNI